MALLAIPGGVICMKTEQTSFMPFLILIFIFSTIYTIKNYPAIYKDIIEATRVEPQFKERDCVKSNIVYHRKYDRRDYSAIVFKADIETQTYHFGDYFYNKRHDQWVVFYNSWKGFREAHKYYEKTECPDPLYEGRDKK